jgi:histidinol dehydrogenase
MIKILDNKTKNFNTALDKLLSKRKNKVQLNSVSVTKIIQDVKKNGDKAILKYEKKFNKNSVIVPNPKKITQAIKSLDTKVKIAIDLAYDRI